MIYILPEVHDSLKCEIHEVIAIENYWFTKD